MSTAILPMLQTPVNTKQDANKSSNTPATIQPVADKNVSPLTPVIFAEQKKAQQKNKLKEDILKIVLQLGVTVITLLVLNKTLKGFLEKAGNPGGQSGDKLKNIFEDYTNDNSIVTLDKLPGMKKVKEFIQENVLNRMERPDLFDKEGIAGNVGAVFYGPPGTGKTNIIKSLAKKIGAKVVQFSTASDGSPYVNQASINFMKKADQIIETATSNPGQRFFVVLDEVESFLTESEGSSGGEIARQELVKTTLQMLDKFKAHKNIYIFATTNTMLDKATGKRGAMNEAALSRFGIKIPVDNPDKEAILGALRLHLGKGTNPFAKGLIGSEAELSPIAQMLESLKYSYRDIETVTGNAKKAAIEKQMRGQSLNPKQIILDAIDAFKETKDPGAKTLIGFGQTVLA